MSDDEQFDGEGFDASADDTIIRDATALSRRGRRVAAHPSERDAVVPGALAPVAGPDGGSAPDSGAPADDGAGDDVTSGHVAPGAGARTITRRRDARVPDGAAPAVSAPIRRLPASGASHLLPRSAPDEVSVLLPARESVDGESVAHAVHERTWRRAMIVLAGCVIVPAVAIVLLVLLQLH